MRVYGLCLSSLLILGFMGCGGDEVAPEVVPPLQPVSGVVTLDGEPAQGVSVVFVPSGTSTGNGATAMTDASGKYELLYRTGDKGIPAGDYKVLFSKMLKPDGSPLAPGEMAADVAAVNALPAKYMQGTLPDTQAKVTEGGGTFDFKLSSK